MRKALFLLSLLFLTPALCAADWQLVWSDEFNIPGRPDPAKWNLYTGFHTTREAQYYTGDRPENVRVENGHLVIEARREDFPNPDFDPTSKDYTKQKSIPYTSAMLTTKGKFSWTYGRFEARAKIPKGQGMWPAVWFLGDSIDKVSWPACGEIDLMEALGRDPNHVFGTLHFSKNQKHASDGGKKYYTVHLDDLGNGPAATFRKPEYLIFNLALGGDWGGQKVDNSKLPQTFEIDYIRVYQQKPSTTQPAPK